MPWPIGPLTRPCFLFFLSFGLVGGWVGLALCAGPVPVPVGWGRRSLFGFPFLWCWPVGCVLSVGFCRCFSSSSSNTESFCSAVFLLCTASIYHCNNVIVDADICCARILRARALLWARYRPFRYVPRLQLVTMRRLQDAFGTIKSFPRSVFCSGQTVYIIYTGYTPRGSF